MNDALKAVRAALWAVVGLIESMDRSAKKEGDPIEAYTFKVGNWHCLLASVRGGSVTAALATLSKPCPRCSMPDGGCSLAGGKHGRCEDCVCGGTGEITYEVVMEALWQRYRHRHCGMTVYKCASCKRADEIITAWEKSDD